MWYEKIEGIASGCHGGLIRNFVVTPTTAPCHEYEDDAVVSPQRTVRVFSSLPCGVVGEGEDVPCPEVVV